MQAHREVLPTTEVHCSRCTVAKAWVQVGPAGGTHPCSRQHAAYFARFFSVQPNHLAPNIRSSEAVVRNALAQHKRVPCRSPPPGAVRVQI